MSWSDAAEYASELDLHFLLVFLSEYLGEIHYTVEIYIILDLVFTKIHTILLILMQTIQIYINHNVGKRTSYMYAQQRFRSDCAFAQSDQNLHWTHFG